MDYVLGLDVIGQKRAAQNPEYFLYDGHGSVRQVVDDAGAVLPDEQYDYDAYGQMTAGPPNPATSLRYTGEMWDSNLSMYNLRARWYDPSNGRFNQMDPFAGNMQDPQSLHKYLYCHCNPINNIDPSGMFGIAEVSLANTIRMILVNVQADVGFSAQAAVEAFACGLSVERAVMYWLGTIALGAAIGVLLAVLSRVVSRYIAPLLENLLDGLIGIAGRMLKGAMRGVLKFLGRSIHTALEVIFRNKINFNTRYPAGRIHGDGFLFGLRWRKTLRTGDVIDRISPSLGKDIRDTGHYFAKEGTPFEMRSLPDDMMNEPLTRYEVLKPFDVDTGFVAPWKKNPGMGIQHYSELNVAECVKQGYLKQL